MEIIGIVVIGLGMLIKCIVVMTIAIMPVMVAIGTMPGIALGVCLRGWVFGEFKVQILKKGFGA